MTKRKPKPPPAKRGAKKRIEVDPTLAPRIQACLERGLTHKMTCAECGIIPDTFYRYIREIPDFSDMVSRAETVALAKAVKAFATGLQEQKVNHAEIMTFTETRIGKDGKPYQYSKETRTSKLVETPPDWRAGEAWLKRRDPKNWSERLEVQHNIRIELVLELVTALETAGISAEEFFTKSIARAQQQAIDAKR